MNISKLVSSFSNAFQGIFYAFRSQRNMGLHVLAAAIAIAASFYFKVEKVELLFVVAAIFFVFTAEMLNTAMEATVDLLTDKYHILARIAKNVAAGAVLLAALFALIVAFFVFGDKF